MKEEKNRRLAAMAIVACLGLAAAGASAIEEPSDEAGAANFSADAQAMIQSWPDMTKKTAQALIEKYGPPDESTDDKLVWNNKDDWKSIAVNRDVRSAAGPSAPRDFIENVVRYKVPADKVAALSEFDGGLTCDEVTGTLSARGDGESSNILALNLADDIVNGKRDVASAKSFQSQTLLMAMSGKSSDYTQKLRFTPDASSDASPAEPPIASPENQPEPQEPHPMH